MTNPRVSLRAKRSNLNISAMAFLISFSLITASYAQETVKAAEQLQFAQGLLSRGMYDMAILQCQKFISENPHSSFLPEAYLSLGEAYFQSQDFKKAVDTFGQFKQMFPSSEQLPVSLLRLAQIAIQQKEYDEAIKELTSIDAPKQLKGQMLQSFDFYMGQSYLGKADDASALDYFSKASQVDGAKNYTAYAYNEIGKINQHSGHYNEAMDAYTKSKQSANENELKGEVTYRAAEVLFLTGKFDDAVKGFEEVISQYPNLGFTQNALANMLLAYFNLGQYDQLLGEYQKDSKLIKDDEPSLPIHFAAVMGYVEAKQYDPANALLDRMLAFPGLKPEEKSKIFVKKSDVLIKEKKFKEALALLDSNTSDDKDDADEILFLKGQGFYGIEDYDHAFNSFENVYQNFPNSRFNKAALLGQAHARQKTNRYKEAEGLFLKYVDIQSDPALKSDALYDAVMMAFKDHDIAKTISSAQTYLTAFPQAERSSEVLLALADSYGRNNQASQAVKLLKGYLAAPPVSKPNSANFLLGYNLQSLGNSDDAIAAYAQVDQAKEEGKFFSESLKNIALIYLSQKNEGQANAYFDRLISQSNPNDLQVKTYIWVCNEFLKQQKFDDVLRVATLAEKNFPTQSTMEINYFKAEALRGLGRCEDADKSYAVVISSNAKNSFTGSSHIGYGLCLADAKNFDGAKVEFQKSLDENADDATITLHARFEMGNAELAKGNQEEALKIYLLITDIYDSEYYCSESLLRAGKILEQLGRKPDALKLYEEILDKYKSSAAASVAQERILKLQ